MVVNVQDRLGSEGSFMPVKHRSCLLILIAVFSVILSLFIQCVLLIYTQLYQFMLVQNCTFTASQKN